MGYPLPDTVLSRILTRLETEKEYVFLETTRITAEENRSLLFLRPVGHLSCFPGDDPVIFFQQAQDALARGFYLAGWMAYEFGFLLEPRLKKNLSTLPDRPLARFGVFPPPLIFDHCCGEFKGADPWPSPAVAGAERNFTVHDLRPNMGQADYITAVRRIKEYIEAGDTYQVNFTLKLLFTLSGSPEALYEALRRNQSVSYGACIRWGNQRIMSFSPELFFKKDAAGRCTVRPMKGTIRRGRFRKEDEELALFLQNDGKNRSENVMIVDLLRNDLGRICTPGSIAADSLFDIETYETLHQMTSTVTGHLAGETSLFAMMKALFPCGSVTGAPKIRTMEIIRELEAGPRGIYTGAIGYLAPDGQATFNVPIRTIRITGDRGEMGIGSGVVHDSDPQLEWQECLLKGQFLTHPAPPFKLIETILWLPDRGYWLLAEHLERLADSASFFLFFHDRAKIEAHLHGLARSFVATPRRVRLTLAKDGVVDCTVSECEPPAPLAFFPPGQETDALPRVSFSARRTDPASPYLYHKTTLRDLYEEERRKALAAGCCEVLFRNNRDEVTEGSISNIFLRRGDTILTPPVASGLLNGVLRRHLLARSPLPVQEAILSRRDIEEAQDLFVGNSVRGLVRVRLT